jgi:hypothetical protein
VEFVYSSQVFHAGTHSTWDSGEAPAPHVLDLLGGQYLRSMHAHYDLDAHLVSTTSPGGLLVH